jgi:hypothetical protein
MGEACNTCAGEEKWVLIVKCEGKRSLARRRHKWEDIIKMDLKEIGWETVDRIDLDLYRDSWRILVNMLMKFVT